MTGRTWALIGSVPVFLAAGIGLLLGGTPAAPEPHAVPALQEEAEYVGSDLCQECHADQWDSFTEGVHYGTFLSRGEEGGVAGCESCHGPGSTHVEMAGTEEPGFREAIVSFTKESPRLLTEQCMECHSTEPEQRHFRTSQHLRAGVTCADCHNAHEPLVTRTALRMEEPGLCYDCHAEQRGQFSLTEHHPVNEGLMTCSDCHTPHGGPNPTQLLRAENETCTSCHLDKAGPWVFQHPPVEAENCAACHKPHGSVNAHMLNFREMRFNCLQCHPSQPPFHVQPGFAECNACHTQIHGSNLDRFFLR